MTEVAGYWYHAYTAARERIIGVHEPHHSDHAQRIGFDVIDREDWNHCRICIGAYPNDRFLHITGKGTEPRTYRTCPKCADRWVGNYFTEEAVNTAKDDYVQQHGGQRLLDGYRDESEPKNE